MRRSDVGTALADGAIVVAFVVIGRDTHDEASTFAGFLATLAPFFVGLAVSWLALGAERARTVAGGVIVAVATVAIGLVVRRAVFAGGTAAPFVLVAFAFVLGGLSAVRLGARYLLGRRARAGG